jgi:hypothetical protein
LRQEEWNLNFEPSPFHFSKCPTNSSRRKNMLRKVHSTMLENLTQIFTSGVERPARDKRDIFVRKFSLLLLIDSFGTFLVCLIVEACLHVCSLVVREELENVTQFSSLREDVDSAAAADVNDQEQKDK